MSSTAGISTYTTSSLLSSLSSTASGSSTSTTDSSTATDTDSATSAAYSVDITPSLIRASLANTYDTQLIDSLDTDTDVKTAVLHDYYKNLSAAALKLILSSEYDFLSTGSGTTTSSDTDSSASAASTSMTTSAAGSVDVSA